MTIEFPGDVETQNKFLVFTFLCYGQVMILGMNRGFDSECI
jgi:hypothetical protein